MMVNNDYKFKTTYTVLVYINKADKEKYNQYRTEQWYEVFKDDVTECHVLSIKCDTLMRAMENFLLQKSLLVNCTLILEYMYDGKCLGCDEVESYHIK